MLGLVVALGRVGRHAEALATAEEAVALYRHLDRDNPAIHRGGLAYAVRYLAVGLEGVGQREEALTRYREAGRLFQDAAQTRPEVYAIEHADTQRMLRDLLRAMGRATDEITTDLTTAPRPDNAS